MRGGAGSDGERRGAKVRRASTSQGENTALRRRCAGASTSAREERGAR